MKQNTPVEMELKGIALEEESQIPVLLLTDINGDNTLPISVGVSQASTIIMALEGVSQGRPGIIDSLVDFFITHGFEMYGLEIYKYENGNFYSRLSYHQGNQQYAIDICPSDGIIAALRFEVPIFATKNLLRADFSSFFINTTLEEYTPQPSQYHLNIDQKIM